MLFLEICRTQAIKYILWLAVKLWKGPFIWTALFRADSGNRELWIHGSHMNLWSDSGEEKHPI